MSQIENHWNEVARLEAQIQEKMTAMGVDWHDDAAMTLLANECKAYGPEKLKVAYQSHDRTLILKAELFGLVSVMLATMENAALDDRDVHGGEAWKAFGKHLY
ncbi:MAG: hypothetical protein LBG66_03250 [Gallionellaceae bacterium]|jgi:hypothetical protein|nr:hypothetical protein [Gallionellaceae bacterium]